MNNETKHTVIAVQMAHFRQKKKMEQTITDYSPSENKG